MDFRKTIRTAIGKNGRGIEIGASYSPILPKAEGYKTLVVDHTDADGLRSKYAAIGVDVSRLETVDAIDDGGEFRQLDLTGKGFDFIVASHVFEHLTDPVHFLQRCERALKPGGRVYLLIPDRRYTFDYLRPSCTAGHLLAAYMAGQKRHGTAAMFDHHASHGTRGGVQVWLEGFKGEYAFAGTPQAGYAMATRQGDDYVDCHAWVFTPSSFRLAMADLHAAGVLGLREEQFYPTVGCEFFAVMSANPATHSPDRLALALDAINEAGPEHIAAAVVDPPVHIGSAPSAQNAIDAFKGQWVTAFPAAQGLQAGTSHLHEDPRILWLAEKLGGWLNGKQVLELGPLEAAHTATLLSQGAGSVLAIEANRDAFLRCLVAKEILGLRDASFRLGNFVPFLESETKHWPLIVASGVLYHMTDPLHVLDLLADRTDRLFLWTHVVDDNAMPAGDRRRAALGAPEQRDWHGRTVTLYPRPYGPLGASTFCGGMDPVPRWIHRDDLLWGLAKLGFDDLAVAHETPDNEHGPSLSILATRSPKATRKEPRPLPTAKKDLKRV
ncbi:methyltransferase domain-containing protein [Mesorhizobium sp. 131-3-5]|uniref:methyltransferase domain-containing protein n=1 Tax=Mesorhizobium sp. 131-3-5 TaxID=2744520 RepID=UPI001FD5F114|nr:methyltransferase domain-containing protein [Mesorhizobium sp. 131-3-5]